MLNCASLQEWVPEAAQVCDVGSGAGLPGIVLALARPDVSVTLVEPLLRRTTFLDEVVADLSLANVEVVRGRAESLHGQRAFDVVTSRAVAPLPRLLAWSMPLVRASGALVAMKGSSIADEVREAAEDLERWGCAEPQVGRLGVDYLSDPTWVVRVAWADPAAISWPSSGLGSPSRGRGKAERGRRGRRRS